VRVRVFLWSDFVLSFKVLAVVQVRVYPFSQVLFSCCHPWWRKTRTTPSGRWGCDGALLVDPPRCAVGILSAQVRSPVALFLRRV